MVRDSIMCLVCDFFPDRKTRIPVDNTTNKVFVCVLDVRNLYFLYPKSKINAGTFLKRTLHYI